MKKDLISVIDLGEEILPIVDMAIELKGKWSDRLKDRTLALLFEKPSLRTRVSFETAMMQLGGQSLYLSPQEVQMGKRESVHDVAKVLSRYVDIIAYRGFSHEVTRELASYADIPIINALDDAEHPCQAIADVMTVMEVKGHLSGIKLAYVGDGNNVCHSLLLISPYVGMDIAIATPREYRPRDEMVKMAREVARDMGTEVRVMENPTDAVMEADVVYTDTWVSMGSEGERERRLSVFGPYQVNEELTNLAKPDFIFMHCLPAHRGEEVSESVIDGPHSVIFQQAENRLHAQKAVLLHLLGEGQV